ncbi:hypothetical protein ECA02_18090 [Enterococcus casseliflavus]|jgi:hypothetical protein|nr:hypothetical protein ECA02_18090 [Enterococcus casseliflavus]
MELLPESFKQKAVLAIINVEVNISNKRKRITLTAKVILYRENILIVKVASLNYLRVLMEVMKNISTS